MVSILKATGSWFSSLCCPVCVSSLRWGPRHTVGDRVWRETPVPLIVVAVRPQCNHLWQPMATGFCRIRRSFPGPTPRENATSGWDKLRSATGQQPCSPLPIRCGHASSFGGMMVFDPRTAQRHAFFAHQYRQSRRTRSVSEPCGVMIDPFVGRTPRFQTKA
jgi:hypothetical protein